MYLEYNDRYCVRKALGVAAELASDELAAEEFESMFPPNLMLILSALQIVTDTNMRTTVEVTNSFSELELIALHDIRKKLLAVLTVSGAPRSVVSDNVELSDIEISRLEAENDELYRKLCYINARRSEIGERIFRSGESKLKRGTTSEA